MIDTKETTKNRIDNKYKGTSVKSSDTNATYDKKYKINIKNYSIKN